MYRETCEDAANMQKKKRKSIQLQLNPARKV